MIGGFIGTPIGGVINVDAFFLSAAPGSYALSGQSAAFNAKLLVTAGSYTISGQAIVLADNMAAVAGAYAITGQPAALSPRLAAPAGSYVVTGQGAAFADRMPVTAGAYALTGQAAAFNPTETIASGAYAIAATPVRFALTMTCASGAYALTGSPAFHTELIKGAGGDRRRYGGPLRLERRRILVTDDEGVRRRVDLLERFRPPAPFGGPAPEWALPGERGDTPAPTPAPLPMLALSVAPALPQTLPAVQDARDENEIFELLTRTADPLAEDIRGVLAILHASGQLERLLEPA